MIILNKAHDMRLSTKVAYNTIIQTISKTIAIFLGLVSVAIMTRYLGADGFGEYTIIMTFLSFFAVVADFGLTLVTVQMISRPGANENIIINNLFTLRLVSGLIFLSLAPIVALFFPYNQAVKIGIAIAAASFLFSALNQILVGLFQKKLRLDKVSLAEVTGRISLLFLVIAAAYYNYGLLGMLLATIAASFVSFVLHFWYSRLYVKIKLAFDFVLWKNIIAKSWPLAITIFFNLLYLRADILILSLIKTQTEVGIYGAAYKVIDVLASLPFVFAGIILPILTASWEKGDQMSFKKVLQKSFDLMVVLAIPMMVGTEIFANKIMTLVAGNEFSESGKVLKILVLAAVLIFLACMFSHAIIAIDKQKKIIWVYVFTSITALIGYLWFIPRYSYIGAAWVTIYAEAVIFLGALFYIWNQTKFFPNLIIGIKSLVASGVMALVAFLMPASLLEGRMFLLAIVLLSLAYFTALYLLGGISKNDIKNILNR